ncbi:MAG: type I-C CRISPR-associated protein Cas8c/Csd1 [Candidatus Sulfopaludibacter sp.]|nr:type I-C CRISPR-associated protein Cas8c/Csd1 [Candidatus Sulfopaludibacter sp.]
MILRALRDLAIGENLLTNPDYEPKTVAWIIHIDDAGKFAGLVRTVEGKKLNIPRRAGRTSAASADFLVDKSEYALGICRQEKLTKPRKPKQLTERLSLFRDGVRLAHRSTGAAALGAVADFLGRDEERGRCAADAEAGGYQNNDLFAFSYQGELVHDLPEVKAYFSASRHDESRGGVQCLVCGRERPPVDKHPGIKLPGGTTSGVALVSFNSNAFESYGLSRNENAPVCRECADAYTTALNRCTERNYVNPEGEILARRSVWIPDTTVAVYWADQAAGFLDLFSSLFDQPEPEAVRALLEAPQAGRLPSGLDARLYCLLLSGAQGRAIVRGLHTGTVFEVEANVRRYFESIEIGHDRPFSLRDLLRAACLLGKTENLPPSVAGDFFLAILFGRPYPGTMLTAAVSRCRAERKVPPARAALLRACLIRNFNQEVTVGLDKENSQPAYRLGRLLAVLERLQGDAQRGLNRTIVDRYYGAASTRPATVFPALIRLAQHHLAKTNSPGFHQTNLGEVMDGIREFPSTLSLNEQGLFAIGYYHQRQQFWKPKDKAAQTESGESE